MKKTISLLVLLVIGFTSCNGRITANQSLTESIEEFKINTAIESQTYIPEVYTEISNDTLLSNGFRVKTTTFTDMDHSIVRFVVKDSVTYKKYYRDVEGLVTVNFKNKCVFEKTINKGFVTGFQGETGLDTTLHSSILP